MSIQEKRTFVGPFSLPEVLAGAAGLAAVIASLAGFIPGLYRDPAVVIQQSHGYDAGNVVVAAVLGIGLIWSARGSARGRIVAIGALACLVYSYVTYAFLIVLNPATFLYIAVLSFGFWSVAAGLLRFDSTPLQSALQWRWLRRGTGGFLVVVAALFALNWLRQMSASVMSGQLPADLVANGWPMNPVWVEDLGFVLPLMALGGILLLTKHRGGIEVALAMLVFMPMLSVTILAMAVSMAISGQTLDMALVAIFGTVGIVSTALAATWLRSSGHKTTEQPRVPSRPLRPSRTM